jgi:hypothetical protein
MAYFVFDLDETLGDFYSVFHFLCNLRNEHCGGSLPHPELRDFLDIAYTSFVSTLTSMELSESPLGLLRPGILDIMHRLKILKDQGLIKSLVIYSNNGHLANLELARDIIQMAVQDYTLFSDCIHWERPERQEEYIFPKLVGHANKTWEVLYKLLTNGPTQASKSIQPNDIYFFDDQKHVLMKELPEGHYIKVDGYSFKASSERIATAYQMAIEDSDLLKYPELFELFFKYIREPFSRQKNIIIQFDEHIQRLIKDTRGTVSTDTPAPEPDKGIKDMKNTIDVFEKQSLRTPKGGAKKWKRTRKRKQRRKKHRGSRRR